MCREDFKQLANLIISLFPNEIESVYYVGAHNSQRPRGKLYDAYNNERSSLSKSGSLIRRVRKVVGKSSDLQYEHSLTEATAIDFLKTNVLPWEEIIASWILTRKARKVILDQNKISTADYISQFLCLSDPNGYELVICITTRNGFFLFFYFIILDCTRCLLSVS